MREKNRNREKNLHEALRDNLKRRKIQKKMSTLPKVCTDTFRGIIKRKFTGIPSIPNNFFKIR